MCRKDGEKKSGRCWKAMSDNLKAYQDFASWLASAVLEEDWDEASDFYAEVICRKLTKLGHLKVEDNKYTMADNGEKIIFKPLNMQKIRKNGN